MRHYIQGKSKGKKFYLCYRSMGKGLPPKYFWDENFDIKNILFADLMTQVQKVEFIKKHFWGNVSVHDFLNSLKVREWKK